VWETTEVEALVSTRVGAGEVWAMTSTMIVMAMMAMMVVMTTAMKIAVQFERWSQKEHHLKEHLKQQPLLNPRSP